MKSVKSVVDWFACETTGVGKAAIGLILHLGLKRRATGAMRMANGLPEPSSLMGEGRGGRSRRVAEDAEKSKTMRRGDAQMSNIFGQTFA